MEEIIAMIGQQLLPQLSSLIAPLKDLGQSLLSLAIATNPTVQAFEVLGAMIEPLAEAMKVLADAIGAPAKILAAAFKPLADAIKLFGQLLQTAVQVLSLFAEFAGSFGMSLAPAQEAANLFASGISQATQAVMGVFDSLISAVGPFVQALNPSLMIGLNYAMDSLKATIGVALVPVVEVLIGAVHQVAGTLLPAMESLAPVMRLLTRTLVDFIIPPFSLISDIISGLAPVLELFAGMAQSVGEGLQALTVVSRSVIQSLMEFVKALFGGGEMKDFLKSFRDGIHMVVESLLKFTAYLAKAFGALGFIDKLTKNLRDLATPKHGAPPAPKDVGIKGFEDIAKTMAQAAFAATDGGTGADDSEKKWLKHLADTLDDVKTSGETLQGYLTKLWDKAEAFLRREIEDLPSNLAKALHI